MSLYDSVQQLDALKDSVRANPNLIESVGPAIRALTTRVRQEWQELAVEAGNKAQYCHSHSGSHCRKQVYWHGNALPQHNAEPLTGRAAHIGKWFSDLKPPLPRKVNPLRNQQH